MYNRCSELPVSYLYTLLYLFLVSFCQPIEAKEQLIAHVHPNWPPTYYLKDNEWLGSAVDLYRLIAEEAFIPLALSDMPWQQCLLEMRKGTCHIQAQLTPTAERKEFMYFIGPHGLEDQVIGIRNDLLGNEINSLEDLIVLSKKTGLKIAIRENRVFDDEVTAFFAQDENRKQIYYHTGWAGEDTLYKMIVSKQLLGTIEERLALIHNIRTAGQQDEISIHSYVIASTPQYFGVSKKLPKGMLDDLRAANKRLIENGSYEKIEKKWSGLTETKKSD
jgi:ABC-type amino acid transport substrate-binding protein